MIKLKPEDKGVILFSGDSKPFPEGACLVSSALEQIARLLNYGSYLIKDGINCEVLQPGAEKWMKGKVKLRLSLEFIPDEPEETLMPSLEAASNTSSLDEIRQMQ